MAVNVPPQPAERRKATPRIGSEASRNDEMAMEAQAALDRGFQMFARHAQEAADQARETAALRERFRRETQLLADRRRVA